MKKILLPLLALLILPYLSPAQLPAAVPTNGLVAWYPLGGTASDAGPNGLNGTNNGASPSYDRFGSFGSALNFSSNYLTVPSNSLFNTGTGLSVSAWVNLSSSLANQKIVGRTDLGFSNGFIFAVENGQVYPEVWDNGGVHYTLYAGSVASGAWDHLVMTWQSGGYLVVYVNAVAVDSIAASAAAIGANADPLIIGGSPWSQSPLYFPVFGDLDDIGIWNRALNAQEVLGLYQALPAGIRGPEKTPVLSASLRIPGSLLVADIPVGNCLLNVTDLVGKSVYRERVQGTSAVIGCGHWTEGVYFITAVDGKQHRYATRVVVTR